MDRGVFSVGSDPKCPLRVASERSPLPESSTSATRDSTSLTISVSLPEPAEFIGGPENRLVEYLSGCWQAALEYHPIVISGPSGFGKTHLLEILVSLWNTDEGSVVELNGADFARRFADAVETNGLNELRDEFTECGLLAIDDVDQLAKKPRAQNELLYLLDQRGQTNRASLLTLREAPANSASMHPGLVSRLAGGLIVPLAAPGEAARQALVHHLSRQHGMELEDELVERLARPPVSGQSGWRTVPQLNHALCQLQHAAELREQAVDLALIDQILGDAGGQPKLTLRGIATKVATYFGLRVADLKATSRRKQVVRARGMAMFLARRLTSQSLEQIGRYFGNRDHTTVLHACRRMEQLLLAESDLQHAEQELSAQLQLGN